MLMYEQVRVMKSSLAEVKPAAGMKSGGGGESEFILTSILIM